MTQKYAGVKRIQPERLKIEPMELTEYREPTVCHKLRDSGNEHGVTDHGWCWECAQEAYGYEQAKIEYAKTFERTQIDNIVRNYPSHPSKFIVVRMVIEVDTAILEKTLAGEDNEKPLTANQLVVLMQREMEQIKEKKFGIPTKLPDWFKAVDCAEIEENKEANNG